MTREQHRMSMRAAWMRYFSDIDVFLCPTNFTAAFPHDSRPFGERTISTPEGDRPYVNQSFWIAPVGAQIIGPHYEDDTAVTFAELLADVTGGYEPPPPHPPLPAP
ncbi:MAG: hypothetical protein ACRDVO_12130 [Jiangellaceae bacterium]